MGIGLNSGPFMSGQHRLAARLEYTAIGDTINTGSRIEGMTKGTPYMAHVADSTVRATRDEAKAKLVYVDEVEIRGRTTKMKLWGFGLSPTPPKPAVAVEGAGDPRSPAPC